MGRFLWKWIRYWFDFDFWHWIKVLSFLWLRALPGSRSSLTMKLLQKNKHNFRKYSSIRSLNSLNKFTDEEEMVRETGIAMCLKPESILIFFSQKVRSWCPCSQSQGNGRKWTNGSENYFKFIWKWGKNIFMDYFILFSSWWELKFRKNMVVVNSPLLHP